MAPRSRATTSPSTTGRPASIDAMTRGSSSSVVQRVTPLNTHVSSSECMDQVTNFAAEPVKNESRRRRVNSCASQCPSGGTRPGAHRSACQAGTG